MGRFMLVSIMLLLLLLLGASSVSGSRGREFLDSSSTSTPFYLNADSMAVFQAYEGNRAFSARWSARKLLYRTQYGICRRDSSRPICDPVFNVICEIGGNLGCWSCEMIQKCTPQAVGCYIHSTNNITYCGF